ncbi:MAG: tetratricopeptide repeat protein [Phycisphaerales bacterium]|nr:tetratricopeptide repeat protein [Phycisphaerales bacterium]
MAADPTDLDALWNHAKPAETERAFRELLPAVASSGDVDQHAQLLTQVARTQGLQRRFDDAHATLDTVEAMLTDDTPAARIRYLLERGRALNSGGSPAESITLFREAWTLAPQHEQHALAVDAAHMLAIVDPTHAMAWNERALAHAESCGDEQAGKWRGSLYNNMGWDWHDQGEYTKALDFFEKCLAFRVETGDDVRARQAQWCVARALRALERHDEALARQQALAADLDRIGEADGFVHLELGELALVRGDDETVRRQFGRAWELLSEDVNYAANNAEALARMKSLATGEPDGPAQA